MSRSFLLLLPGLAITVFSGSVFACASCGCTLSSDWESQGFTTQPGLKIDLRYDYLNQDQLRHGKGTISPSAAALLMSGNQEVEKYTRNNYFTLGLDYTYNSDWGVNLQLPYIDRKHSTLGTGTDGATAANGAYDSDTKSLGDVKLVGRYQGFTSRHNLGLTFGLKLPTASHTKTGILSDPANLGGIAGIDPGLQPGTGTTDAILGIYYFDALNQDWDYFAQAGIQMALDTVSGYKPGAGYNLNLGLRYMSLTGLLPQIQLNTRHVEHDTGANADLYSTGGTLIYLSPGLTVPVSKKTSIYGFVQLPVYQDVRGVQLAPRYTASLGARFAF